jgi:exodeoxyribonuclease-5
MAFEPSAEQQQARKKMRDWLAGHHEHDEQLFQTRGPAGSGKTTVAVEFANLPGAAALTFTGKAASVLRRKGARRVATIHSYLFGSPKVAVRADGTEELQWLLRDRYEPVDLLVVDEVSQIDATLGHHLLARGIPIVTFGDSVQLPPIDGQPAFFDRFSIDAELKDVHRQALNSPVLRLATQIREDGLLPKSEDYDTDTLLRADVILCAMNETRQRMNFTIRRKWFDVRRKAELPIVAERVVCLRNDHGAGIWNGTLWEVKQVTQRGELLELDLFDEHEGHQSVLAPAVCFTEPESVDIHKLPRHLTPMDFGYALTVHKSQGSEWPRVAVLDETRDPRFRLMSANMPLAEFRRRWLYVAVSRAREQVDVIAFS